MIDSQLQQLRVHAENHTIAEEDVWKRQSLGLPEIPQYVPGAKLRPGSVDQEDVGKDQGYPRDDHHCADSDDKLELASNIITGTYA